MDQADEYESENVSLVNEDDMEDEIPFQSHAALRFANEAERFAKALDSVSASSRTPAERRADVFKLANRYYNLASENARRLRANSRLSGPSRRRAQDNSSQESMDVDEALDADDDDDDDDDDEEDDELRQWELEAQTWDLLRRLLPLRHPDRKLLQTKRRDLSKVPSGGHLWDEFLQSDITAQERKAILECMQDFSDRTGADIDDMVREYQQKADRGDIVAHGWLHTRTAIKMRKSTHGWNGPLDPSAADVTAEHLNSDKTELLVTQLDPDVVTRQRDRKLEAQDEYFERAIWLGCYELLRRGRSMSEIRDWCVERTEVWRAVSMSAMPLARDGEGDRTVADPLSTMLWRRTCYALARNGGTDDFERAVYGVLSGDIPSVEKVCKTWDDFIFAHYNALLRSQFDSYVMKRSTPDTVQGATQSLPVFNALQFHGDSAPVGERIVQYLETNPKTSEEARQPVKSLQAAIIADTVGQFVHENGLVLGRHANKEGVSALVPEFNQSVNKSDESKYFSLPDPDGLRVLVHVFLLLSSLEEAQGGGSADTSLRNAQENVLAAYVSALRLHNLVELLPLYCSKMRGERAFFTLSRNVSLIVDPEERNTLLRIMSKLGMDPNEFVVFQPNSLLKEHPEGNNSSLIPGQLNIFLDEPPSLKYGRRMRPDFFGEVPDALDPVDEQLIQSLEWMTLGDDLADELFSAGVAIYKRFLKNYNLFAARALSERVKCADVFRKAGLSIADEDDLSWFPDPDTNNALFDEGYAGPRDLTTAKNFLELESMVRVLDAMETVASSEELAQDTTNNMPRDFWVHIGEEVKRIKHLVQPCLRGWLKESTREEKDFELLRDMYLPETVLGYISVLHFAGTNLSRENLLECMELAATIAEKDSDLAAVLMKNGRMKEVVEGFASCSKALAVSGADKKSGGGGSSKKMRELGWSRELWSVKR